MNRVLSLCKTLGLDHHHKCHFQSEEGFSIIHVEWIFHNGKRSSYGTKTNSRLSLTQPTFRRRMNVVSTSWINFEITLIWRWKWNKIRRRNFNVAQRWYNVSAWRWNNADTTLYQRCCKVASTSAKLKL